MKSNPALTGWQFVWSFSFLSTPVCLSAATVVTTNPPVRSDQASPARVNLNSSLGPTLDLVDDLEIVVQDFGSTAFLIARGIPSAQVATDGGNQDLVKLLSEGDSVDSTLNFESGFGSLAWDSSFGSSLGEWSGGGTGYLGLRFEIAGSRHYGFVRITWFPQETLGDSSAYSVVDKIGYNSSPEEPAFIPEPFTSLMVALSVLSLALGRRR